MASYDFNSGLNDFKDIMDLMSIIFDHVSVRYQRDSASLFMKEGHDMIDLIEKNGAMPTNTEKLRLYTFIMILMIRSKVQSIEKNVLKESIKIKFIGASEKISMSLGDWIKYFINPAIEKIDHKIDSFKSMKEVADDFKIALIKLNIESYFSEKLSIDNFRNRINQIIIMIDINPRAQELIKSILELCKLPNFIGIESFELGLENILLKF
jgi:hypothetical protein